MTPEEKARENIDTLLVQAGWKIQNVKDVNFDYVPFSQQGGLGMQKCKQFQHCSTVYQNVQQI